VRAQAAAIVSFNVLHVQRYLAALNIVQPGKQHGYNALSARRGARDAGDCAGTAGEGQARERRALGLLGVREMYLGWRVRHAVTRMTPDTTRSAQCNRSARF
jgi:hypothetical protein